jgi:hypothetical protein
MQGGGAGAQGPLLFGQHVSFHGWHLVGTLCSFGIVSSAERVCGHESPVYEVRHIAAPAQRALFVCYSAPCVRSAFAFSTMCLECDVQLSVDADISKE